MGRKLFLELPSAERTVILLNALSMATDKYVRHGGTRSVLDLAVGYGLPYGLKRADFRPFLEKPLSEVLHAVERTHTHPVHTGVHRRPRLGSKGAADGT